MWPHTLVLSLFSIQRSDKQMNNKNQSYMWMCSSYLPNTAVVTLYCDSLWSGIFGLKFMRSFMKHCVSASSLTTGEICKLSKIGIPVWSCMDRNHTWCNKLSNLSFGFTTEINKKKLSVEIESCKSPEKYSKFFHENSTVFYTFFFSWNVLPCLASKSRCYILKRFTYFIKQIKRKCKKI